MASDQAKYTLIPKQTNDEMSIQEHFKSLQKDAEEVRLRKFNQKIEVGRKLKDVFDNLIRSVELESNKWQDGIGLIRKQLQEKPQDEYMLTIVRFTEFLDTSTALVQSTDIPEILRWSLYSYRKRININAHPLNGCLLILRYKEDAVHLMVDVKEPSCCLLM